MVLNMDVSGITGYTPIRQNPSFGKYTLELDIKIKNLKDRLAILEKSKKDPKTEKEINSLRERISYWEKVKNRLSLPKI